MSGVCAHFLFTCGQITVTVRAEHLVMMVSVRKHIMSLWNGIIVITRQ